MSDVRGGKGGPRSSVRLCLDLESVVAATHPAFIERYNDEFGTSYSISDVDSWDWVEEEIEFEDFMRIVDELWQENGGENIEPNEPDISTRVKLLSGAVDEVKLVTARVGVEESMEQWLKRHGVWQHLDGFVATETYKSKLGYDIYIDDNHHLSPEMSDDQHHIIYHQKWNDHADTAESHNLYRAKNLVQARTIASSIRETKPRKA